MVAVEIVVVVCAAALSAFIGALAGVLVVFWQDQRSDRQNYYNLPVLLDDDDVDGDALAEAIKGAGGTDTYAPPKRMGRDADKGDPPAALTPAEMP